MKLRLVIEVPRVMYEGEEAGDFRPNLDYDVRELERKLPREAVVISAEYVPHAEDTKAIFKKLLRMKLEGAPLRGFKSGDYYSKGDEDAPFFSEAYLYNLVGKDDARTVLGYIRHLMEVAGLDPLKVEREISAELAMEAKAEKDRQERVAKLKAFKDKFCQEKGWVRDYKKSFTGLTEEQNIEMRKALKDAGF